MFFHQIFRELHPLFGIHQVDVAVRVPGTATVSGGEIVVYDRASDLTFFRGNHDYPVCGFYPVNCRGGGIFQNIDTVNVSRVKSRDSVTDTVDIIRVVQFFRVDGHGILHDNSIYHP